MSKDKLRARVEELTTMLRAAGKLAQEAQRLYERSGAFAPVLSNLKKALDEYDDLVIVDMNRSCS